MQNVVNVIGGGLAGCEAAWQIARQGIKVRLFEMRPHTMTPAHHTEQLAELVCSNSLRSNAIENAVGLLKEEMRRLDSLIMSCADANSVAAGSALAVDRHRFSHCVTEKIENNQNIEIIRREVTTIPDDSITIIATGPLTSERLVQDIQRITKTDYLHFYDAAAPIVTAESINFEVAFWASRYDKGEADYLNCPMTKEEYERFYQELIDAEVHQLKDFERNAYFEGCMPVEVMAKRGSQTLLFGPLKPVGLIDPHTGKQPYAVVQLRKENEEGTLFNIVGFQTSLKWPEQRRVFGLIPGLEEADFVRFGMIHRNTFLTSPKVLRPTLQAINNPNILFAGQITGVEGYVESASNGLVAGINAGRLIRGLEPVIFPPETAHGALCRYITTENRDFQPMNVNFSLFPPLETVMRDKSKKKALMADRALRKIEEILKKVY